MFQELGKVVIGIGVLLVVVGALMWVFGKLPFAGRLPGDILVKRENFTFYAPIATGIIISIILSIIITIIANLRR
jgi:hypothetical protein